jgi:hypothetical protein
LNLFKYFVPFAAFGIAVGAASGASAQTVPACSSLPNVVYMQVGDTQEPLMKALGQKLRANTPYPLTLVYTLNGSCTNVETLYTGVKLTTNPSYVPSATEDPTWDPSKPSPTCTIDPAGVDLQVGVSATFVDSCNSGAPPAGISLFTGPIQAYVFVTPEASTQQALTAEEGYFVFGFGAAGQAMPWTDESLLFIRPPTKSSALTPAAAIGVPAAKLKGVPLSASNDVVNSVSQSTNPEATMGLLGVEIYDQHRDILNALAFRAFEQRHAYYPDSTSTAFDKQNVRDGHYLPWSPTVYIAHTDANGAVTDPRAKYVIDLVTAKQATPAPNFDPLSVVIGVNVIPECAMKVTRSFEGGDLSLYSSPAPCGCFYESLKGTPSSSCQACPNDGDCATGVCRHGYCEAR